MPTPAHTISTGRPSLPGQLDDPDVTLRVYASFATITKRGEDGAITEHPFDPSELSKLLNVSLSLQSGLLPPDVIWIAKTSFSTRIAAYRPPQITGIWLGGAEHALHVPLPGLILIHGGASTSGAIFAVKETPHTNSALFNAPLPNIGDQHGLICWGTVPMPDLTQTAPNDLSAVWRQLFGSAFINHDVAKKSIRYPKDVRQLLVELHDAHAAEYPLDDLVPATHCMRPHQTLTLVEKMKEGSFDAR